MSITSILNVIVYFVFSQLHSQAGLPCCSVLFFNNFEIFNEMLILCAEKIWVLLRQLHNVWINLSLCVPCCLFSVLISATAVYMCQQLTHILYNWHFCMHQSRLAHTHVGCIHWLEQIPAETLLQFKKQKYNPHNILISGWMWVMHLGESFTNNFTLIRVTQMASTFDHSHHHPSK